MFTPKSYCVSFHACRRAAMWVALLCLAGSGRARAQPHNDFSQASSAFTQSNVTFSTQEPKVMLGPTFGGTILSNGQPTTGNNVSQSVGGRKILDSQFNTSAAGESAAGFNQTWNGNKINENLNGSRVIMGKYDANYSSFNGKEVTGAFRTAFPQGPNLQLKMMPDANTSRPQFAAQDQKFASWNDSTAPNQLWEKNTGPSKFSDAVVIQSHLGDQAAQMQALGHELSMQDINRYEFSGSNSSEPGLPVIKAGGSINASSAGTLSTGPALFDPWESSSAPTSQVHSGAAVAPHMLAPSNGNSLMPSSQNSSSSQTNPGTFTPNAVLDRDGVSLPVQIGPRTIRIPPRPGVQVDNQ